MFVRYVVKYTAGFILSTLVAVFLTTKIMSLTALFYPLPADNPILIWIDQIGFAIAFMLYSSLFISKEMHDQVDAIYIADILIVLLTAVTIYFVLSKLLVVTFIGSFLILKTSLCIFKRFSDDPHQIIMRSSGYAALPLCSFNILYFLSFSTYRFIWWYQNWNYLKEKHNDKSWPIIRSLFPIFFYEKFLDNVQRDANHHKVKGIPFKRILTDYYIFLVISSLILGFILNFSYHYHFPLFNKILGIPFSILLLFIFLPVQKTINQIHLQEHKKLVSTINFSSLFFICVGLSLWCSAVTSLVVVSQPQIKTIESIYNVGNYSLAYKLAIDYAEEGDAKAQYLIGKMYLYGLGVKQGSEQALTWLEKAGEQNLSEAQFLLGVIYREGRPDIPIDYKKSVYWYEKAVAHGSVEAANDLAVLYASGKGVEQSEHKASALYIKAAIGGDGLAMYNIGYEYAKKLDYYAAASWYQSSLEKTPNACALNDLAILYAQGKGVPKNLNKSEELFTLAGQRYLMDYGHGLFDGPGKTNLNKQEQTELVSSFVQYQFAHRVNEKQSIKSVGAPLSSETKKTAAKMSKSLASLCWE